MLQSDRGGDGGNRNRVRKPIPATFYECSLSFEIPLRERRQTGYLLRYPLVRDTLQGYSRIHVHHCSTPLFSPWYY